MTGSNRIPITVWLYIYLTDINISRKLEAEIQKKIFEIAFYDKIANLAVSETYFPLRGPIPGHVTESNPVPITVWLNIYLTDINI